MAVHPDQQKREVIPTRKDLPTQFHPFHDLLMVIPIPDITKVGSIILPQQSAIQLNEGHVVEKGPRCSDLIGIGDCVTWDTHSEYKMDVDGVKFVLVREGVINMFIPRTELESTVDENQLELSSYTPPILRQDDAPSLTEGEDVVCPACGCKLDQDHLGHAFGCPEDVEDEV